MAVKVEPVTTRHPQLTFEAKLYRWMTDMGDAVGIPKVLIINNVG